MAGHRLGKGEGFADLEFAMMRTMGAVTEDTIVVTTVHDHQVIDIPERLMESHDLTVDYIVTPTEIIKTNCTKAKPTGIIWSKLDRDKLNRIPVLKLLRKKQRELGVDVRLKVTCSVSLLLLCIQHSNDTNDPASLQFSTEDLKI